MANQEQDARTTGRRQFISEISATAVASGLVLGQSARADDSKKAEPAALPTIRIGKHEITRLVAGWNPIGGYSYMGRNMDRHMKEYFTDERTVEFLAGCERQGINAHQFSRPERMAPIFRTLRERGSKMQFICLYSNSPNKPSVKDVIKQTSPIAIVHHGGATDKLFREGKAGKVRDFVKEVRDAGVLAGVSAHNPDCIKQVADEGWDVDLFMNCFYQITRPAEEIEKMPKVVTLALKTPFFLSDPVKMTALMRQVKQPCLGFKILGAGRMGFSKATAQKAFEFAFKNIKPTDGVIVGMYPRYFDEVADDVQFARQFGKPSKAES